VRAAFACIGVLDRFSDHGQRADLFLPCAWGIAGKDGKPMKEPPHPPARGKVRHVGDPVAIF